MKRFIQQHADQVRGVLSGFDGLRFRGTLRWLAHTQGMFSFLCHIGVLLKDFKAYAQGMTERVRAATQRLARAQGRPLIYLDSPKVSKEETARQIAQRDGVREGLICVFSAVESCFSYEIRRDATRRRLGLHGRPQKCLHYYFYFQHPQFGFMHLRLQPWSAADADLLAAVARPEFAIHGFRNRDLRTVLFGSSPASPEPSRRQSAKVTRQLRMLRAHGLILKVAQTHRYQLTASGRTILAALHAASRANAEQLAKLAA